ncbi:MAG TPA: YtcA family lipoprotein [Chthoniobacterales bacterium]|nr:YtcA family lipoprotein [Chthoniobacterales bacterium]
MKLRLTLHNPEYFSIAIRLMVLLGTPFLVSCDSYHKQVPSLDVFGSYFPAWLISLAAGIVLTLIADSLAGVVDIRPAGFLRFLLSVSLILIFSISVWFWFYSR